MTICKETTFKELKKLVGSTKELTKLPTAKKLRNSDAEIVFKGDVAGAHFIIYKNGLFIYSRGEHATVYAVDRCSEIEYSCVYTDEGGLNVTTGCNHMVKIDRDGQKHLIMIVPETEYMNYSWVMPLDVVGAHRLDHNMDSREESHSEFSRFVNMLIKISHYSLHIYILQRILIETLAYQLIKGKSLSSNIVWFDWIVAPVMSVVFCKVLVEILNSLNIRYKKIFRLLFGR